MRSMADCTSPRGGRLIACATYGRSWHFHQHVAVAGVHPEDSASTRSGPVSLKVPGWSLGGFPLRLGLAPKGHLFLCGPEAQTGSLFNSQAAPARKSFFFCSFFPPLGTFTWQPGCLQPGCLSSATIGALTRLGLWGLGAGCGSVPALLPPWPG